jgi:hypothetical protein
VYFGVGLFLGDNEEGRSGIFQVAPETVSRQIGSISLDQEMAEGVDLKLPAC